MTLRISARLAEHANARHDSHRASPAASMSNPFAVSAVVVAVSTGWRARLAVGSLYDPNRNVLGCRACAYGVPKSPMRRVTRTSGSGSEPAPPRCQDFRQRRSLVSGWLSAIGVAARQGRSLEQQHVVLVGEVLVSERNNCSSPRLTMNNLLNTSPSRQHRVFQEDGRDYPRDTSDSEYTSAHISDASQ
jgi:hypothetical protein